THTSSGIYPSRRVQSWRIGTTVPSLYRRSRWLTRVPGVHGPSLMIQRNAYPGLFLAEAVKPYNLAAAVRLVGVWPRRWIGRRRWNCDRRSRALVAVFRGRPRRLAFVGFRGRRGSQRRILAGRGLGDLLELQSELHGWV